MKRLCLLLLLALAVSPALAQTQYYMLQVSPQDATLIINALAARPYAEVAAIVPALQQQIQLQNQAAAEAAARAALAKQQQQNSQNGQTGK